MEGEGGALSNRDGRHRAGHDVRSLRDLLYRTAIAKFEAFSEMTEGSPEARAFVTLEDLTGQIEGLVFPRVFERYQPLLREDQLPRETNAIYTAASKGIGLENLVNNICRILGEDLRTVNFILPYAQAGVLDKLYREANVKKAEYVETGIDIEAVVDQKTYGRIRHLLPEDQRDPEHEEF